MTDPHNCVHHHLPFTLGFINNTAQKGGDAIYGPVISDCRYGGKLDYGLCQAQELLRSAKSGLHFEPDLDSDPSQIFSDPTCVRLCENRTLNYGKTNCYIQTLNETH